MNGPRWCFTCQAFLKPTDKMFCARCIKAHEAAVRQRDLGNIFERINGGVK